MLKLGSCQWLLKNANNKCGKSCYGEHCGVHAYLLRNSPRAGTNPCIRCGVGVRGKIHLCNNSGRNAYRAILTYYRNRVNKHHIAVENPPSLEEFIADYKPRKMNKLVPEMVPLIAP